MVRAGCKKKTHNKQRGKGLIFCGRRSTDDIGGKKGGTGQDGREMGRSHQAIPRRRGTSVKEK